MVTVNEVAGFIVGNFVQQYESAEKVHKYMSTFSVAERLLVMEAVRDALRKMGWAVEVEREEDGSPYLLISEDNDEEDAV